MRNHLATLTAILVLAAASSGNEAPPPIASWRLAETGRWLGRPRLSPDGRYLAVRVTGPAAGGIDAVASVDLSAGRPIARVGGVSGALGEPFWLPPVRLGVVAADGLRIWPRAGAGRPAWWALLLRVGPVAAAADGRRVAVAMADGGVAVLDARTGAQVGHLATGPGALRAVLLNDQGELAVTAEDEDADRTGSVLTVWRVGNGARLATVLTRRVVDLAWSGDAELLSAGAGGVATWRLPNLALVARMDGGPIAQVDPSPRRLAVALVDDDGVAIWPLDPRRPRWRIVGREARIGGVCYAGLGRVAVSRGERLLVYDVGDGHPARWDAR